MIAPVVGLLMYFTFGVLTRPRLESMPATEHVTLTRESCLDCHAPIAAEWRESFHFQSLTGPFWTRIRKKGFARLFRTLRVPCVNCHAPANILDLGDGVYPVERSESIALGVDCVSCHVSRTGIRGPGRTRPTVHETTPDERFRDGQIASRRVCARCHDEPMSHARTVAAWLETSYAREGISCVDCHMPIVEAPSTVGGPVRPRRSHRFPGDKDPEMLRRALNATLRVTGRGEAVVRIVNDRTGHSFPASGMNWLIVRVAVRNSAGETAQVERRFGVRELIPGYLDFAPFQKVSKIPFGDSREVRIRVLPGPGTVTAEFLYRDWFAITDRDVLIERLVSSY